MPILTMKRKHHLYLWGLMFILFFSCQVDKKSLPITNPITPICVLENNQTDYQLQTFVQLLEEPATKYTIQDITQPAVQAQFQVYPNHTLDIENYKYYWGKIQIENRLTDAEAFTEWFLYFNLSWTTLEVFTKDKNGAWKQDRSGIFTSEALKKKSPKLRGNLIKIPLLPREITTIYFRGASERAAINPSFSVLLYHVETLYTNLLKDKIGNAIFTGFLLMMFLYNLILYFYGRDRSFLFYSGYLVMVVIYSGFASADLTDWLGFSLFPQHPEYWGFLKLSLYVAMMCYLAFIRSFLDLEQLLPKWDKFFKVVIYLGFPLMVLDVIILLTTNFSHIVEDRVSIFYIFLVIFSCFFLMFPLYKTKDKKGYFIIGGISVICVGAFLTVLTRIAIPPFTVFYLKGGTIIEVIIFSLGLAYRLRQQKVARQQADFDLQASQMIQEQRQLEADRLKELNDFKTQFYTNITHEFRTPLTVIMGMSDNLKNHSQEKMLIQRNSKNLLRLINQLLDLSKLESGKLNLNLVHQDLIVYLQYLTESFYSTATQKDIRLVFYSEEKEVMMDYDEEKIQQVVYNLLSNALKFTSETGKIIFHASRIEKGGRPFLKLKIKDNGIGMSPENVAQIFDRFYQGNHAGTNPSEGTGIGLSLTKELVELMHGRIEVESQVGEGTEFTVFLPIESAFKNAAVLSNEEKSVVQNQLPNFVDPTESQNEENGKMEKQTSSSFPDLLIIEDNPDIIIYIQSILKNTYNIHTAKNGKLGIEKALDSIPDVIISDVMMPEKNGYEVCEFLKKDERTSHIPIILLTAKSTQSDKIDGLKHGADAYLTKPFDKKELLIRLKKLVDIRLQLQLRYANIINAKTSLVLANSMEDIFLQKLHEQIQLHLSDTQFGVPQLAATIDLSQMQLYRKLKALTGKTPSQFIRSYRLQQALELLQTGKFNVSEVAYDVGFSDPSYFSRMFHKEFGKNPSQYLTN
ncbi:MAG: signal transduction histidine kinase/DNA-binding response OmpR family regulator [Granulosicoccus sp.]|jgi:signal transduction histidine kinase/DNA-binding response OmpR family regulator